MKKKRNKKQIATERNASGEKPKSELKQSTSTKEEDLGLDEKEKIKKKRQFVYILFRSCKPVSPSEINPGFAKETLFLARVRVLAFLCQN